MNTKRRMVIWIVTGLCAAAVLYGLGMWLSHKQRLLSEFEARGLERSYSGFHHAVTKGDVAAVALYLKDGFSPNARYDKQEVPILSIAASKNRLEIVRALISAGADVNAYAEGGYERAIHTAALYGHAEVVKELIKAGADVNAYGDPYYEGGPLVPLESAALGYSRSSVLEKIETKERIETVKVLLEHGARVNVYHPRTGEGALHTAASSGFSATVLLLVKHDAELEHEDADGYTPLMSAAASGRTKTVETLLAMGAQPNHRTHHGTALLRTIQLIQDEADNRLKNRIEFLPEDRGLQQNRIEVVRLLLNAGADPKLTNAAGKNAYDFARHFEITRLLKAAQSRRDK